MFKRGDCFKLNVIIFFLVLCVTTCSNNQIKSPPDAMAKLDIFIAQDKFIVDKSIGYYGLENPFLKPVLSSKINAAAYDFRTLAKRGSFSEQDYSKVIQKGLQRFSDIYITINIEDRIRICRYFEELMDIVGIKSSAAQLNNFIYGSASNKR